MVLLSEVRSTSTVAVLAAAAVVSAVAASAAVISAVVASAVVASAVVVSAAVVSAVVVSAAVESAAEPALSKSPCEQAQSSEQVSKVAANMLKIFFSFMFLPPEIL